MGKATIVSHRGRGLYSATIEKDVTGYDRNIATAGKRFTELDTVEIPALITEENEKETEYGTALVALDSAITTFASDPTDENRDALVKQNIATNEARFAWENAKLALKKSIAERSAVSAYKTSQESLRAVALAGVARDIWCADLTTSLIADQVVGTFDIANESFNNRKPPPGGQGEENTAQVIIRPTVFTPGNQNYSATRDGIERASSGDMPSGLATFFNWAVKPAWVIGKPTGRVGILTRVDYVNDKGDVIVENFPSWIRRFQTKPFGQTPEIEYGVYKNLPIEYMNCNARAFVEGDRVLIDFENQSEATPVVVGFETNPRECTSDGFNYTRYNVAGPYANLNDVGAGWVVDTSGSPTIVGGNIDVQTHGNTRTTGGTAADPLRFHGPYRRHFGQLQDPRLDVAPQPFIYGVNIYQGRSIEATCPGKVLGVGSQDDVAGDEIFIVVVLDESSVQGSTEVGNTVGFYRRTYAGTSGLYEPFNNPLGWQKVGTYTFPDTVWEGLDLPFFFSSDGTKCAHIHYKKAIAAEGTFQIRANQGDTATSPTMIDATKPKMTHPILFEFQLAVDFTTAPVVTMGPDEMSSVVFMREELESDPPPAHVRVTQSGRYPIAAEYLDNVLTVCRVDINYLQEMIVNVSTELTASPGGTIGSRTLKADVNNRILFERFSVTGTAQLQDAEEGFDILKDTGATFILDVIVAGMEIENTTTEKKGTVLALIGDTKLQTSAMLGKGETELSPIPVSQGWNVGDSYKINVLTKKTLPLASLDYFLEWTWDDTVTRTTKNGMNWALLDAPGESNVGDTIGPYSVQGWGQSLAAAYCYLDPRYGTALVHIMRRDNGQTPPGKQLVVDTPSEDIVFGSLTPDFNSPYHWEPATGMEEYYAIYTAWGEAHRFSDQNFTYPTDLAKWELSQFQNISGFTTWFWDHQQPNVHWTGSSPTYTYYYYEAPEGATEIDQMTASALYQNQYMWWAFGGKFEQLWEGLQSANHGWQDWTEETDPLDKLFAYWYTGQPYLWRLRYVSGWYNNYPGVPPDGTGRWFSSTIGILGGCSSRAYIADLSGFTTCVVGTRPFVGNVATTDGFDVFLSGMVRGVELVRDDEGFLEDRKVIIQVLGFLSGEGSDVDGALTTLLGGVPETGQQNLWFPLGVAPRNL